MAAMLILPGCGATGHTTHDAVAHDNVIRHEEIVYTSNTSAEDCYLCGNGADDTLSRYWGQDNIGIISLNTFEVMRVEINRYDMDGTLLEEKTGVLSSRNFQSQEGGFSSHTMMDVDRGYAHGSISFYEDEVLDVEKAASFLCADCLNTIMSKTYKEGFGVGIINFDTKELRAFEKNTVGFGLGDFYIDCDFKEPSTEDDTRKVDILIFYCSIRYEA